MRKKHLRRLPCPKQRADKNLICRQALFLQRLDLGSPLLAQGFIGAANIAPLQIARHSAMAYKIQLVQANIPPSKTPTSQTSSHTCKKNPAVSPVTPPNCTVVRRQYPPTHRAASSIPPAAAAGACKRTTPQLTAAVSTSAIVAGRRRVPPVMDASIPVLRADGRFSAQMPDNARDST